MKKAILATKVGRERRSDPGNCPSGRTVRGNTGQDR